MNSDSDCISDWIRHSLLATFALTTWLSAEQAASAQALLAQTGVAKTMIGWLLVLLAIGLGILVVCRPSSRREAESDMRR